MWNQRSKYKWFCKTCGTYGIPDGASINGIFVLDKTMSCKCTKKEGEIQKNYFNKLLGIVEITEVFKIHLWINQTGCGDIITYELNSNVPVLLSKGLARDLAKKDGFSSAESMFNWFDKQYDLSTSKEFHVFRWVWAKSTN